MSVPPSSTESGMERRDFLTRLAIGSAGGAGVMAFAGIVQLPLPKVLNEPSSLFKIGSPTDFPVNTYSLLAEKNVFILRTQEGIRALSAICTHLGCIVSKTESGFLCPCHGSRFDEDGNVTGGPAPKPLEWLQLGLAPDGQLTVDVNHIVDRSEVFAV